MTENIVPFWRELPPKQANVSLKSPLSKPLLTGPGQFCHSQNLVFQACILFLRCFRKGNLRKCWQFPISFYRRASHFWGVPDKSGTFLFLPCSHKKAVAYTKIAGNDRQFQTGPLPQSHQKNVTTPTPNSPKLLTWFFWSAFLENIGMRPKNLHLVNHPSSAVRLSL